VTSGIRCLGGDHARETQCQSSITLRKLALFLVDPNNDFSSNTVKSLIMLSQPNTLTPIPCTRHEHLSAPLVVPEV
jgi:hypothetical protein